MKRKWIILIGVLVVVTSAGGGFGYYKYTQRGIVTVQTGRILKQDLVSQVTASGEIKPLNYINIGANAIGRLTKILVQEGDRVRKGQELAQIESVQPEADVAAQKASLASAEADSAAAESSLKAADENTRTLQAGVDRQRADLERAELDFQRAQQLFKEKLIAKQDFDQKRAAADSLRAGLREAEARVTQARAARAQSAAQLSASQRRISQVQATLRRFADVLQKYTSVAPIDGVVTNLPVRIGETVVLGIQSSPSSLIMTIADMSKITAEVKVDETDIVNVKLDQQASITIDAIPGRTFRGHVIEIGNTAILRSTGLAASQSTISSQEAKDFKVVIQMDDPPEEIRPGLSCTAKITTATKSKVLTAPIQALTIRTKADLDAKPTDAKPKTDSAPRIDPAMEKAKKEEIQGIFVVNAGKAIFKKVETGITGTTDIEIVSGVSDGDEIITGSYKVIRTLRNEASIKVDNKPPVKTES